MITNPKKTCLVLDLDDTLYKEYDYQTSGLKYVEEQVLELYDVDLRGKLLELRDQGVTIGAHSHSHFHMPDLTEEEIKGLKEGSLSIEPHDKLTTKWSIIKGY